MKTIVELLKSENAWVVLGPVRLLWDADHMEWAVYERKRGSFRDTQIIVTQNEAEAVTAFVKAAGLEDATE
jgi:hypothetical protein